MQLQSQIGEVHRLARFAAGFSGSWLPYIAAFFYLACHGLAIVLLPAQAAPASFLFLIAAPLVAAIACGIRASRDRAWDGWIAVAIAMGLWSAGMVTTMVGTLLIGNAGGIDGLSMCLYILYGVPLIFAVASGEHEIWYVRVVDGVLAIALGALFFVHTFTFASLMGATPEGVLSLRFMFDIENAFIAIFSLVQFIANKNPARKSFFGAMAAFAFTYLAAAGYINHFESQTDYGSLVDLVAVLPFLLLAVLAMKPRSKVTSAPGVSQNVAHLVRAGSPLMLAATLLVVSCLLIEHRPAFAIAGFIIASLGTGMRNVLVQTQSFLERDKLDEMARIDALTGLANRRQFNDVLQNEWSRARRNHSSLALLMIDIDHFKILNDTLGHPMGDQRLREVASALAGCATRSSDLVARYGGEEFAVILPSTDLAGASAFADSIRTTIAALQLSSPCAGGFVTISIGVGYADSIGTDQADALLSAADTALYDAKKGGRNRVASRALATA